MARERAVVPRGRFGRVVGGQQPRDRGEPEAVTSVAVSTNNFAVMGLAPVLGRAFVAEDSAPAVRATVVVLSHELWSRRFNTDPDIAGRSIMLDGEARTVIGVMPPAWREADIGWGDLWFPVTANATALRDFAGQLLRGVAV